MPTYEIKHIFIIKAKNKDEADRKSKEDPSAYWQDTEIEEID